LSLAGLAIAIGVMADASIVIIENCSAVLAQQARIDGVKRRQVVIEAMAHMMRPLLFSLLIILVSFLPVFFLGEREGRLFDPLAFSKTFAMGLTTLLTLCLLPILVVWAFKPKIVSKHFHNGAWVRCYRRALVFTLTYRYGFVVLGLFMMGLAVLLMSRFDTAYMPELEEGAILYMPTTLPGLPMREAGWVLQAMDRKLKSFPEVKRVFGKLGRANSATDPAPVTMIETTILLKPQHQWRPGMTRKKLVSEMDAQMNIIGYVNSWTQPIAGRVLMQDTGIQSPVGLKIKGHDLELIETLTQKAERLLSPLPGSGTVLAERIVGGDYVDVQLDLTRLAEHGIQIDEAMLTVRHAVGGERILDIQQSDGGVVPLSLRYSPEYIDTLEKVARASVISATGRAVTLESIADVRVRQSAEMIRNDNGERAGYIYIDLEGVTASDYVPQAKAHLARYLDLPRGYTLEWTGTHRYAEQAQAQLGWIIPLTLLLMFVLLMMAFRSVAQSMVILLAAPFALVGGVLLQWSLGYAMTTAVIIGYLAVLAIAIQTGILMVIFIREALARNEWRRCSTETVYLQAVIEGSVARLRPKLITVTTTVLALLPIIFARGSGMEITQPIAAPIIGGMLSSTLYVLFIIPCLFMIGRDFKAD
ncbi:MAG: efflux RND transporter permease subunit, partial [Gammaproteobacteria bacterium]|nr:efflux RND transporter permease subunit [Gammaproteobacteria bacterium]